ncbi:hypothetical protein ZIOFF_039934 [Zingiber officinale]|uniref:Uncharacterized protein n=1 Tax=Zingiber officinale TaxID=94328 RepID=A0A8J5G241_ZINOF|nr:hypothetical protein ZIOFF_039934 [Zingiber officinale]
MTMKQIILAKSTESSKAFCRRPLRCLEKVTCRLARFSILLICVFPLTMSTDKSITHSEAAPNPTASSKISEQGALISPGHTRIDKEGSDRKKEMRNRGYQIWDREIMEEDDF